MHWLLPIQCGDSSNWEERSNLLEPLHGMITSNSTSEHDDEASMTSYSGHRRWTLAASSRAARHPSLHGALMQHQSSASWQQTHSSSPPAGEAAAGAGAGTEKAFFLIGFWVSLHLLLPFPNIGMSAYILLHHRSWSLLNSKACFQLCHGKYILLPIQRLIFTLKVLTFMSIDHEVAVKGCKKMHRFAIFCCYLQSTRKTSLVCQ